MSGVWAKLVVLGTVLCGLCLPAQANTTATTVAQAVPGPVDLSTTEKTVSIALLLPLRSEALREPAEMLRAGFQAAFERESDSIMINIIETGDTPEDILSGYKAASAMSDVVVGPLSRSGVTAVAQSGAVTKPTIALTPPETPDNAEIRLPPQMLVMGLSIEDEARQVAGWAAREGKPGKPGKALVLFTKTAWQRRAAKAFESEWQQRKRESEPVELAVNDGFLNGRELMQLKKQLETDKPSVIFLALDARQARQVRAVMGKGIALYGTSQLNPFALSDRSDAERAADLDGTRLLDIPWQLQPDHPAVMVYPRMVLGADQKRNADFERLYALGIDAYRVAREILARHSSFEIDGVTGRLTVRLDQKQSTVERTAQQAVYRDGSVVGIGGTR